MFIRILSTEMFKYVTPLFSKLKFLDNKYCIVESNLFFVIFSVFLLPKRISNSAFVSTPNWSFVSKNVFNNNSVVISFSLASAVCSFNVLSVLSVLVALIVFVAFVLEKLIYIYILYIFINQF